MIPKKCKSCVWKVMHGEVLFCKFGYCFKDAVQGKPQAGKKREDKHVK